MNKKCTKYEALFTFADANNLKKHLKICEDCRQEQQEMDNVSNLIKEVKPYLKQNKQDKTKIKAACILFALIIGGASLGLIGTNEDFVDHLRYGESLSAEDLGFPVDAYGLLLVD